MRVFITGASGWIGSAVTRELITAGHHVDALSRSEATAAAFTAIGIEPLAGDLDSAATLAEGARNADAVIHLANKHDWSNPAETNRAERAAVSTLTDTLAGTGTALIVASGLLRPGAVAPAVETDTSPARGPESPRGGSENLALESVTRGVTAVAVRFAPSVHAPGDHGFVAQLVAAARRHGVSGFVGNGDHAWAAVHRDDAASLVRMVVERPEPGLRVHAVAEPAVLTRDIAAAIGDSMGLPTTSIDPDDAIAHFGFVGRFFSAPVTAANEHTRNSYGWNPTGATLVEDIIAGGYR